VAPCPIGWGLKISIPLSHAAFLDVDLLAVPRSHIRTASHLKSTSIAVEFGGAVAEHIAGGRFIKLPGGTMVAWPLPARSNG
jgi:hypothetical protein